ncbi:pre-rRNA-processing protein TSR2 homolog [Diadema setosum]|uniref:pre-rRNA-processing protein TSR2 homolog n=1 Tax=Diadema setosum TaxID=31175 RepID=UPI003B3B5440
MAGASDSMDSSAVFHKSIQSTFDGWTGLQIAVRQGFGGPHSQEKARWMVDAVYNWFQENEGIESFELEDFLADILDHEFDTIAEDDSLAAVSESICTNFQLCQSGRAQSVLDSIQSAPMARIGDCVADAAENMDDDDAEEGGAVQDANVRAMLGGMGLGQSHDRQNAESSEVNHDAPDASSSSGDSRASTSSKQNPDEDDDGWTVVGKNKRK